MAGLRARALIVGLGLVLVGGGLGAAPAAAADPVTLSGAFRAPPGIGSMEYQSLDLRTYPDGEPVDSTQPRNGTYSIQAEPGDYWVRAEGEIRTARVQWLQHVTLSQDTTVDFVGVPVIVNLVNQNGRPRVGNVDLVCDPATDTDPSVHTQDYGAGLMRLVGTPVAGGCDLEVTSDDGFRQTLSVPVSQAGPNEVTVTMPSDESVVSGVVTTDLGDLVAAEVRVLYPDTEDSMATAAVAPDGSYHLVVSEPGDYVFEVVGEADGGGPYPSSFVHRYDVAVPGDRTFDAGFATTPVTLSIEGSDGTPRSATASLDCVERYDAELGEEIRHYVSSQARGDVMTLHGFLPEDNGFDNECVLWVYPEEGEALYQSVTIDPGGTNEITVVLADLYTVSGSVSGPDGPLESGLVRVRDASTGDLVADGEIDGGSYSVSVAPGTYEFTTSGNLASGGFQASTGPVEVTGDQVVHVSFPGTAVPVTVHLVGEGGVPDDGYVYVSCLRLVGTETTPLASTTTYGDAATGTVVLDAIPTDDGWTCRLERHAPDLTHDVAIEVADGGSDVTLYTPTGAVIPGDPGDSADGDGVPDLLEAQGPNDGDGNGDGTPDHQQAHVTSLPADGSGDPADPYLTIAGPVGSTLVNVSTVDVADVATPPPAGVSLPAGLASFTVTGVSPGADAVVSVFPESMTGINGYAKYDADSGTWSVLPGSRVQLHPDRVDVTLTDGGVGDADDAADGRIVDPGGVAVVPTGDVTPPVVTGTATQAPNANGWYRSNVRIRWSAVDPSGIRKLPADTVVSGEGSDLTAQSALVCDRATPANCTRGVVTGLKIDRTAPVVSIGGVTRGATYTLGAVPTATCTASDALSGPAGPCTGALTGGKANGVGRFTYTATATDRAGNRRTVSVGYNVVYRFDGFLQPLNDPRVSPGTPMSVFRKPSTVSAALVLRSADGSVVTPGARPAWLSPVRGARTGAGVNEASSSVRPSSGSAFTWRGDRWQYDWSTRQASSGYLYRLGVRLDDGTTHYLTVGLR